MRRHNEKGDVSKLNDDEDKLLALSTMPLTSSTRIESPKGRPIPGADDRMSTFWRVFGGTILSIVALVGITLYNNQNSTINELRSDVNRLNEARVELVKKDEFNSRQQAVWDRVQSLQGLHASLTQLKEQLAAQSAKNTDLKTSLDRLAQMELRLKSSEDDHKLLLRAEIGLAALEQKATLQEAKLKSAEEERKELVRQLQELRERLAKFEGISERKPAPLPVLPKQN